ncbi:hypothetical protein DRP77_00595 [Candidatus Poribacteria bacterium]|nr:MAG: hypothetical protein DRP77_00595 [Candidatus Poribacteria bacterium]
MRYDETRRRFIRNVALGALGLSLPGMRFGLIGGGRSKVVISKDPGVISEDLSVNSRALGSMLDEALAALTGKDPIDGLRSIFSPKDVVGIKVNTLSGRRLSTHPELAYAVAERLIKAGVKPERIIIWDRFDSELREAGYRINRTGRDIQCYGTEENYDEDVTIHRNVAVCFSLILRRCTALINLPVLKQHEIAGVTIALKNWFGAIHNPNKYHDNGCDPYIADLSSIGELKRKKRLVICDALLCQYEFGPSYKPRYAWREGAILVSRDEVALDRVGMEIIDRKRKEAGLKPLRERPEWCRYIFTAADREHRLGVADLKRIEVVRV